MKSPDYSIERSDISLRINVPTSEVNRHRDALVYQLALLFKIPLRDIEVVSIGKSSPKIDPNLINAMQLQKIGERLDKEMMEIPFGD